jgi:alkylhydroperoxidase family enzyme
VAGLTEDKAGLVDEGYETRLSVREVTALKLTDNLIGHPHAMSADDRKALAEQFTEAEIAELAMGVGLFLGMSKVLIILGLEPEDMPTTVIPTPGS